MELSDVDSIVLTVLLDGLICTPSGSRIADPIHLLVGNDALAGQLVRREPITAEDRHQRKDEVTLHEIERLYGRFKLALRAQRGTAGTAS
jgi:hypothetical protein